MSLDEIKFIIIIIIIQTTEFDTLSWVFFYMRSVIWRKQAGGKPFKNSYYTINFWNTFSKKLRIVPFLPELFFSSFFET